MSPALRRTIVTVAAGLVVTGAAVAARVGFTGETQSGVTFAGGWIGQASGLSVTPSGYDAVLNWTPGTHGPVTGQQLWSLDNGTSSTCPASGFTQLSPAPTVSQSTYTKSNTSSVSGHWLCFQAVSTSASSWTATSNFPATQLGLVAKSVAITNSGTANKLTTGDKITITFNQNVAPSSVPTTTAVCTGVVATQIYVGDTTCSNTSDPITIGIISGFSVSGGKQKLTSTAAVSGATVTITVGQNGQTMTGSATSFVPATTILSAATTDQALACNAANCQPVPTGGF
jgi:hypothetical protein